MQSSSLSSSMRSTISPATQKPSTQRSNPPTASKEAEFGKTLPKVETSSPTVGGAEVADDIAHQLRQYEQLGEQPTHRAEAVRGLVRLCRELLATKDHISLQLSAASEKVKTFEDQRQPAAETPVLNATIKRAPARIDDTNSLRETIKQIEKDIVRFDGQNSRSINSDGLPDDREILLAAKFGRLEELIVVLKKRITRLEEAGCAC